MRRGPTHAPCSAFLSPPPGTGPRIAREGPGGSGTPHPLHEYCDEAIGMRWLLSGRAPHAAGSAGFRCQTLTLCEKGGGEVEYRSHGGSPRKTAPQGVIPWSPPPAVRCGPSTPSFSSCYFGTIHTSDLGHRRGPHPPITCRTPALQPKSSPSISPGGKGATVRGPPASG